MKRQWVKVISDEIDRYVFGVVGTTNDFVTHSIADVCRMENGKWRWRVYGEKFTSGGSEPSRKTAVEACENEIKLWISEETNE